MHHFYCFFSFLRKGTNIYRRENMHFLRLAKKVLEIREDYSFCSSYILIPKEKKIPSHQKEFIGVSIILSRLEKYETFWCSKVQLLAVSRIHACLPGMFAYSYMHDWLSKYSELLYFSHYKQTFP
jgi:hypothetical protein